MRRIFAGVVAGLALLAGGGATGAERGSYWIEVTFAGGFNDHIIPVIWFSEWGRKAPPESLYKDSPIDALAVLPPVSFRRLVAAIRALPCTDNIASPEGGLAVIEFRGGKQSAICKIKAEPACDFLFYLENMPALNHQRDARLDDVEDIHANMRCKGHPYKEE